MNQTTAVAQRGQIEELELSRPYKLTPSADFYGAIFGTAAAIALMVVTFIFAPLFIGITLLVIGIVSIVLAAIAVTIKHLVLLTNTTFLTTTEVSKKDLTPYESETNRSIKMTDGTTLKGFFYANPENQNKNIKDQKLAIYFPGNGEIVGNSMSTEAFQKDLEKGDTGIFEDHSMYSFAYRGTNESTGRTGSIKQNALDGFEVIKAAVAQGYDINNITLYGVSFGGSVAPLVKQLCLENNIGNPALLVVHTFHTLDTFISGNITDRVGKAFVEGISKFLFFISEYSHHLTAENWNKLGTRNFCIGGGAKDRVINPDMCLAKKLQEADPDRRDTLMRNRDHNDLKITSAATIDRIREMLELPSLVESPV